ncbi:MAG: aspartate carbamoyltransferase catalytic subunit [Bacteroidia bacterium]|nr:aspartate carbamoyltransferase catalytic subunit [Bacteroidia bacterium]
MLYQSFNSERKHLTSIEDLANSEVESLLAQGQIYRESLDKNQPVEQVLQGISIANLFFENSTRTRISFELAEKHLGGIVVNFAASNSSVSKGETLLDTVLNIVAMGVQMVVIRHQSVGAPHFLAQKVNANIINAGDGTHEHPTQALLDALTLKQHFGDFKGLRVAIVGDILHSRVARSNVLLLNKLGVSVRFCGPPTLLPPSLTTIGAEVSYSLEDSLEWADAVITLRIQAERQNTGLLSSLADYANLYQINEQCLSKLSKIPIILHPGPINHGVEISNTLMDSTHTLILDQVTNGVAMRMAILNFLNYTKNNN